MKCKRCGFVGELGENFRFRGDWCKSCNRKVTARWQKKTNDRSQLRALHSHQHWTSEEMDILQQCLDLELSPVEINQVLPRSWHSIRARILQIRKEESR